MVELRDGAALAVEVFAELGIAGERRCQDLDYDGAVEAPVPGFVDFPHPTCTKRRLKFVRTELVPAASPM